MTNLWLGERRSYYQLIASPAWKNPPVGPSSGRVANSTSVFAPSAALIGAALPPRSVFTHPGCAEFTLLFVCRSSCARWIVNMFSAAFDELYANSFVPYVG